MNLFKESLLVRNLVLEDLKRISDKECWIDYNDLYERKNEVVRRLKCSWGVWVRKDEWMNWKNELESISYDGFKIEFSNVNKVNSVGGWEKVDFNKRMFVENGVGSVSEFEDRFNNEDFYFVIRIVWKK